MSALAGLRVLDVTDRTGAFAGKLLAGLGADVVRAGDPFAALPDEFRRFYDAGKRPAPSGDLRRLALAADVVLYAGPPDGLAAHGLADLRTDRPELIVVAITPFGMTGPRRDWKSSDTVAQATGGMLYVNGHADGPPLRSLGLQAYHQAGVFAAIGVLAAVFARETTGAGQDVDVSLQAAVAGSLEHVPGLFHQGGTVPERQGTLHWTRYFRVARCKDGYVMHCTLGDWTSLVEWVKADGMADNLDDPAWDDILLRKEGAEHVFDVLDAWAARYTVAELVEGAQLRRIPYAAVRAPEALLDDPQLAAREFFVPCGRGRMPGAPFRMTDSPWRAAPADAADWLASPPVRRKSTPTAAGARPLDGIRVLDLTWVVAGPVTTRILADLGAEVIKIEKANARDIGDRRARLTGTLMRGKESVVLNLGKPEGVALARRLAAQSDVVIDNFSARVMTNLGLDHETLRRDRPDIITVRMTGLGLTGPQRDWVSYGPTLQALTGYTLLMAEPGKPPAGFGYSYSDLAGGNLGALATLAALWHRKHTGHGQLVDLSQLEAVASLVGPALIARSRDGGPSVATGNASQEGAAAPHGVYRCAGDDRWVAITVFCDDGWRRFVRTLGAPAWTRDPRFASVEGRAAAASEIDAYVATWTATREADAVVETLQAAGVAAGLVADARDLCVRDPQLAARGHFVDVPTPEGRTVKIDGPPYVLSDTPARVSGPGPLLGEHTDAVLSDVLALDAAEIARLRAEKVVK